MGHDYLIEMCERCSYERLSLCVERTDCRNADIDTCEECTDFVCVQDPGVCYAERCAAQADALVDEAKEG